jgi:hypothetical protein
MSLAAQARWAALEMQRHARGWLVRSVLAQQRVAATRIQVLFIT